MLFYQPNCKTRMLNWQYKLIYITFLIIVVNLLQGCRINNKLLTFTSSSLTSNQAKYITIYAKMCYQEEDRSVSCNLKLQIHKEKFIGLSITHTWGIELVRGIITPTGIELINHIDKTYTKYNYTTIQNIWQLPCNYDLIQTILLGELSNAVPKTIQGEKIIIQQNSWKFLATMHKKTNRLYKLDLKDTLTNHILQIVYNYKNKRHAKNILFQEATAYFGKVKIYLQYQKIQLTNNPFAFYFKVPQQYDKI